jgi:hypothetical protein
MKKYLNDYIKYIEDIINNNKECDYDKLIHEHLIQINFMQHERFIHLIVTCFFAVLLFISIGIYLVAQIPALILLIAILLGLVIPYIMHYYFLENNVQKLYYIYNELVKRTEQHFS